MVELDSWPRGFAAPAHQGHFCCRQLLRNRPDLVAVDSSRPPVRSINSACQIFSLLCSLSAAEQFINIQWPESCLERESMLRRCLHECMWMSEGTSNWGLVGPRTTSGLAVSPLSHLFSPVSLGHFSTHYMLKPPPALSLLCNEIK